MCNASAAILINGHDSKLHILNVDIQDELLAKTSTSIPPNAEPMGFNQFNDLIEEENNRLEKLLYTKVLTYN